MKENTMLDTLPRNCVESDEDACEGWKRKEFSVCPGDCPRRMSLFSTQSPAEFSEIADIWQFTWDMLMLPEWTPLQVSVIVQLVEEWRDAGRDGNWYADECIGMLGSRLLRMNMA